MMELVKFCMENINFRTLVWKLCVCVWKSSFGLESLDTWFRTLYLVYGLGLGTPILISCRVDLRRALRLLDMCFEKGLVVS